MLGGTGLALVLVMAFTVRCWRSSGTTLACLNTGVRITLRDEQRQRVTVHIRSAAWPFATPQWGIWVLVAVSAAFGAYGVLNVDNLTRLPWHQIPALSWVYGRLISSVWSLSGEPAGRQMMKPR